MQAIQSFSPIVRAIGVVGAVAVLVTSITFAALSDTATLTDNTMSSATADLTVSNGGSFDETNVGFAVENIIPGTPSAPQPFYLKNASPFDMDISVTVPVAPTLIGIDQYIDVLVEFQDENGAVIISTTMKDLKNGNVDLNVLTANSQGSGAATADEGDYFIVYGLDPTGVSGSQASVGPFDLVFTGTQVVVPPAI